MVTAKSTPSNAKHVQVADVGQKHGGSSPAKAPPAEPAYATASAPDTDAATAPAPDSAPEGAVAGSGPDPEVAARAITARRPDTTAPAGRASQQPEFVPGSELLGRGISIRPRVPYELKGFIVQKPKGNARVKTVTGATQPYLVPPGCEVNDSPPLPPGRATGQTIIEESWNRFGRQVTLSASVAASAKVLSIDATAFQGSNLQIEEDSYYALRSSFIPFWSVYMPSIDNMGVIDDFKKLESRPRGERRPEELYMPAGPFDLLYRDDYARIFERFGTHYVKSAWLGGKASLVFVVTKSANMSKEEVKSGIEATFSGIGKGALSSTSTQAQQKVRNNSSCSVFGSGGDPTELAKLTTLQAEQYDRWVSSVKENPEVIELGVAGIWTLLRDPVKAEALRQAYIQETTFTPLLAVIPFKEWLVFVKNDEVFDYTLTSKYGSPRLNLLSCLFKVTDIRDPEKLRNRLLPLLEEAQAPHLAAQLSGMVKSTFSSAPSMDEILSTPPRDVAEADLRLYLASFLNVLVLSGDSLLENQGFRKVFSRGGKPDFDARVQDLLKQHQGKAGLVNRMLLDDALAEEIAPRPSRLSLTNYLPVLEEYPQFIRPHAAFSIYGFGGSLEQKLYLFKWRTCLRIDVRTGTVDDGYPTNIVDAFPEVDFDRIDAAVAFAPDRLYFFRSDEYIRLDVRDGKCVGVTRDLTRERWPGVIFDKIDTAVYWGSNKIYFFSGDQYIRYDFSTHRADPGYPKFLSSNYVEDWELLD